jgi:hypothetical protein
VLANILIAVCAAPGAFKLLDIFLSAKQKEWIENRTLSLWDRLDESKKMAFSEFVTRNERRLIVISFLVVLVLKDADAYVYHANFAKELRNPHLDYWVGFAVGTLWFLLMAWLGAKLALWVLRAKSTKSRLIRLAVLFLLTLPLLIFLGDAFDFYDLSETIYPVIFNVAYYTAALPVFWAVAVAHLLLIYVAIVFLHIAEFIVRRVAESDKGPILVGSAICAALAALLKAGG